MFKLDKKNLRKKAITLLKNIPDSERRKIEQKLKDNLVTTNAWKTAEVIGITVSKGFEWDTKPIIQTAWKEGKTVCVPKCLPKERKLDFYVLDTYDQLETVFHDLLEPNPDATERVDKEMIDLLVVPGLLFDNNGFRIGFGGGYYDRFLTDFSNRKLSLASTKQIVEHFPPDSFDIPVESIITENGILF
ncbi:5-formyltetrahydrofolate cyclo-ligase [Lentibacillus cibarius]|uniref:5-formyltetrahydrofolate cyclo-ligase n=1 Tax=Lentibacillus cibarius TaxID=2583219 RepID=UPI002D794198|nr:5-formyltetrahydrofolate cyclo-ligase [Lentibacillus cibarius]